MTPQEKLHAVETAIRKALPRLMEPMGGIWVKRILKPGMMPNADTRPLKLIDYGDKNSFLAIRMDGTLPPKPTKIFKDEVGDGYEILGHDILLSDVLEWLGINVYKFGFENIRFTNIIDDRYKVEIEREFLKGGKYKVKEWTGTLLPYVDFSKPRLVDQSEELINFLYNLIKEN